MKKIIAITAFILIITALGGAALASDLSTSEPTIEPTVPIESETVISEETPTPEPTVNPLTEALSQALMSQLSLALLQETLEDYFTGVIFDEPFGDEAVYIPLEDEEVPYAFEAEVLYAPDTASSSGEFIFTDGEKEVSSYSFTVETTNGNAEIWRVYRLTYDMDAYISGEPVFISGTYTETYETAEGTGTMSGTVIGGLVTFSKNQDVEVLAGSGGIMLVHYIDTFEGESCFDLLGFSVLFLNADELAEDITTRTVSSSSSSVSYTSAPTATPAPTYTPEPTSSPTAEVTPTPAPAVVSSSASGSSPWISGAIKIALSSLVTIILFAFVSYAGTQYVSKENNLFSSSVEYHGQFESDVESGGAKSKAFTGFGDFFKQFGLNLRDMLKDDVSPAIDDVAGSEE